MSKQGSKYLADMLKDYGVTHVFYMEAILRYMLKDAEKNGTKLVMAHSENGAGYMADGYARASGKVGVCMAQAIGAGNLTGGITDAYLACSPVMAITGKKPLVLQQRNSYQEYDHTFMYQGITKYNADIASPDQLGYMFREAARMATTGKPRPVHLDVANNLGRDLELATISDTTLVDKRFGKSPAFRLSAEPKAVEKAAAVLKKAKKPVIMAGRGVILSEAKKEVLALAKKIDAPVVMTPDGKTTINENSEYFAGICGGYGMDCANRTLANADLVVIIGSQTNDQGTCDWHCPKPSTKVIQIDIAPEEIGRNYVDCVGLLGDAKVVTAQLVAAVTKKSCTAWRKEVNAYVTDTLNDYKPLKKSNDKLIRPERLCNELEKVLPDNAVLVSDTGYSAVWTSTMIRMKETQSYYRAAGSLGWSLPGSLGVKCAVGDRPVICFIGDGGLYYHFSELETAIRAGIHTVTVINNNGILAQCSGDIRHVHCDEESEGARRFTFAETNYSKLASDLGCYAVRVTKAEEIGPAIKKALKAGKPAVVEVMTNPNIYCQPYLKGGFETID